MLGTILNTLLGIWLMAAPAVLGYGNPASNNDRIFGPIITTFAIIAFSEATRSVNRWNSVFGFWIFISPMVLNYEIPAAAINSFISGTFIILCALFKGKVKKPFAGGWSSLWKE